MGLKIAREANLLRAYKVCCRFRANFLMSEVTLYRDAEACGPPQLPAQVASQQTASEPRGDRQHRSCCLNAKTRIWPWLSYMCRVRSVAEFPLGIWMKCSGAGRLRFVEISENAGRKDEWVDYNSSDNCKEQGYKTGKDKHTAEENARGLQYWV